MDPKIAGRGPAPPTPVPPLSVDDLQAGGAGLQPASELCGGLVGVIAIPFVKAHGARNDFLLTWRADIPAAVTDFASAARAICNRNTGVGADGWILLGPSPDADAAITLYNSDGSLSEISGNGTRCAAALLIEEGVVPKTADGVAISTGAGVKKLKLLSRSAEYLLEMNMGVAQIEELHSPLVPEREVVILNVGNPQCAVFVANSSNAPNSGSVFNFDWRALGAQLERHPRFPNRTNVSFVRVVDRHTLDVRFFERGAGETMSSGTGSTGAVAAAHALGLVDSPVRVDTPAGPLNLRWGGPGGSAEDIFLAGPAEIVARGNFLWNSQ
jgi:diaminopimelate epimerase